MDLASSHRSEKKPSEQKIKTDLDAPKEIRIDSQLCNEQGEICRLFAELKIKKKKLIIDVNSAERANFMENFVQNHLASFVETPTRLKHDLIICSGFFLSFGVKGSLFGI